MKDQLRHPPRDERLVNFVAISQAAYFLATGIWPLVGLRSFERITGPKVDDWLVKTVGGQVGIVGAALALATKNRRITPEIELLAAGSAVGFAAIDIVYTLRRRISPVYLLDAAIELGFAAGWMIQHEK
jgi:hypothetical protein